MTEPTRRDAIKSLCGACLGLTGAACAAGLAPALEPPPLPPGYGRVKVPVSEVTESAGKKVIVRGKPVLLFRKDGEVRAFSAVCPHAGCVVDWKAARGEIVCPCHNGRFDDQGGILGGPVKSPLKKIPVVEAGDVVEVGE